MVHVCSIVFAQKQTIDTRMMITFVIAKSHPRPGRVVTVARLQARMDGVEAPKPRRQDPSRDFVNVWQEIGQSRVYVPQKQVATPTEFR